MANSFYVFRVAKDDNGGDVKSECPVDFHKKDNEIKQKLSKIKEEIIDYKNNNYINFLHKELWECGKLRQGWGVEGLDLRQNEIEWIENYIIGAKKYWGVKIKDNYCELAMGRYKILELMLKMQKGDIIFIPKHSETKHHDENYFTVCEVIGNYYFDLNDNIKDFGHVIPVKIIDNFRYGKEISGTDFSGYYSKAISKIEKHHKIYSKIMQFLEKINYL